MTQPGEIINRVAQSALMTLELDRLAGTDPVVELDLTPGLEQGLILREKDFRVFLDQLDLTPYKSAWVALKVPEDALIPSWGFMWVAARMAGTAKGVWPGTVVEVQQHLMLQGIQNLDTQPYHDKPVLIKGCGKIPIPPEAWVLATHVLQPVVKSLMYGEACSNVPVFKKPRT